MKVTYNIRVDSHNVILESKEGDGPWENEGYYTTIVGATKGMIKKHLTGDGYQELAKRVTEMEKAIEKLVAPVDFKLRVDVDTERGVKKTLTPEHLAALKEGRSKRAKNKANAVIVV